MADFIVNSVMLFYDFWFFGGGEVWLFCFCFVFVSALISWFVCFFVLSSYTVFLSKKIAAAENGSWLL